MKIISTLTDDSKWTDQPIRCLRADEDAGEEHQQPFALKEQFTTTQRLVYIFPLFPSLLASFQSEQTC